MFCWRTIWFSSLSMIFVTGSLCLCHAQTVVRDLNQSQNQLQRTAVVGLLGEFGQCASYEVANLETDFDKLIQQAKGLTPKSSGIIRVIRGGRISQELLYSPKMNFVLMHGDVLIALKSPRHVSNVSSNHENTIDLRTQNGATPELTQIAILNLLDRPVVFGVPAEIANLAGILHSLRQPLDNFPQIAQSIKVIPPQRMGVHPELKTKRLTTKLASGTVLVLNDHKSLDVSAVPRSLPAPRRIASTLSSIPQTHVQKSIPRAEPLKRKTNQVTHPEALTVPSEATPLKVEHKQLQLNAPLLQQTAASLPLVPDSEDSSAKEKADPSLNENEPQEQSTAALSTVPKMEIEATPDLSDSSIQILDDADLSDIDKTEQANTPFLPQWSYYLFLAVIAGVAWKLFSRRPKTRERLAQNQVKQQSNSTTTKDQATIISDWDSLPPMPEKSLLEQILENKIPVIEETAQIQTQTYIYGRHASKAVRVDKHETTLKGPHFHVRSDRESQVPQTQETSKATSSSTTETMKEKTLKAPAFRFDRSHPESSQTTQNETPLPNANQPVPAKSKLARQSEASVNSGILDRVLQAVQGVIPK